MKNKKIIAGNWKMHKSLDEGIAFARKVTKLLLNVESTKVIFCPPFTALFGMMEELTVSSFALGAQNCHWEESGAFTGEISCTMLKELGVRYVITGHSERRHIFGETDKWINNKNRAILSHDMIPIFCLGETFEQRKSGDTESVLADQLESGLNGIEVLGETIIAYEPVWAIGTGLNADSRQIESAHETIRLKIKELYSIKESENISILYGGSVNESNAKALISSKGVDGFLIGGASLKEKSFYDIIDINEQMNKE